MKEVVFVHLWDSGGGLDDVVDALNGVVDCSNANAREVIFGLMSAIEGPHGVVVDVTLFFVQGNKMFFKCSPLDFPAQWYSILLLT